MTCYQHAGGITACYRDRPFIYELTLWFSVGILALIFLAFLVGLIGLVVVTVRDIRRKKHGRHR